MGDWVGFSKRIVCSDNFYMLSDKAKLLYFMLGMNGRKKGEVIGARSLANAYGCGEEALWELVDNEYLAENDDGTFTIVHWYENNGIGETAKKRNTYPYQQFRKAVLERDGYRCKKCGSTEELEVHHIKPFALYPKLIYEVSNGITLCKSCHRQLHKEEAEIDE